MRTFLSSLLPHGRRITCQSLNLKKFKHNFQISELLSNYGSRHFSTPGNLVYVQKWQINDRKVFKFFFVNFVPSSSSSTRADQIQYWENQVHVNFEYEEYDSALESAEKLIALDNTCERFLLLKCHILATVGRFDEAHAFLDQIASKISMISDAVKGNLYCQENNVWSRLFEVYIQLGEWEKLWVSSKSVIEKAPEFADAWVSMALVCLEKSKFAEALKILNHAKTLAPNNAQDAIESQKNAIKLDFDPPVKSYQVLASLYYQSQMYQECIETIDTTLPDVSTSEEHLTLLELKLNSLMQLYGDFWILDKTENNAEAQDHIDKLLSIAEKMLELDEFNETALIIQASQYIKNKVYLQSHDILFVKMQLESKKTALQKQIVLLRLLWLKNSPNLTKTSVEYYWNLLEQYFLWRKHAEPKLIEKYLRDLKFEKKSDSLVDEEVRQLVLVSREHCDVKSGDEVEIFECVTKYCTGSQCLMHPVFDGFVLEHMFQLYRKITLSPDNSRKAKKYLNFWNLILNHFLPFSTKISAIKYILVALNESGQYTDALKYIKVLDRLSVADEEFLFQKAFTNLKLENYEIAAELFETILEKQSDHLGAIRGRLECFLHPSSECASFLEKHAQALQDDSRALLHKAFLLCDNFKYQEALIVFQKVLELDSNSTEALYGQVKCQCLTGSYYEAHKSVQKLLDVDSNCLIYQILSSEIYRQLGNSIDAEKSIRMAYNQNTNDHRVVLEYIQVLYLKISNYKSKFNLLESNYEKDLKFLSDLIEQYIVLKPGDEHALSNRIMFYLHIGDIDKANELCEEALSSMSNSLEMKKNQIVIAYRRGDWRLALDMISLFNAQNTDEFSDARCQVILLELQIRSEHNSQDDKAILLHLARLLVSQFSTKVLQFIHIISNILIYNKIYKELIEIFDELIGDDDARPAILYYYRSEAHASANQHERSESDLNRALALEPKNSLFLQTLYHRHASNSKHSEAFYVAKKLYDTTGDTCFFTCMIQSALNVGFFNVSLQCLESALKGDPNNVDILQLKCNTLLLIGHFEAVLQLADQILKFDSCNVDCMLMKGSALFASDRLFEAAQCFERILSIDSTHCWSYHFLAFIEHKSCTNSYSRIIELQKLATYHSQASPDSRIFNNLACYHHFDKNPSSALSAFHRASTLPPVAKEIWLNFEMILKSQGLDQRASLASSEAESCAHALNRIPILILT